MKDCMTIFCHHSFTVVTSCYWLDLPPDASHHQECYIAWGQSRPWITPLHQASASQKKPSEIWGDLTNTTGPIWRLLTLTYICILRYLYVNNTYVYSIKYPDFCLTESLDSYKKIRRSEDQIQELPKNCKIAMTFFMNPFSEWPSLRWCWRVRPPPVSEPRTVENSSKHRGMKFNFRKHPHSWKEKKLQIHCR